MTGKTFFNSMWTPQRERKFEGKEMKLEGEKEGEGRKRYSWDKIKKRNRVAKQWQTNKSFYSKQSFQKLREPTYAFANCTIQPNTHNMTYTFRWHQNQTMYSSPILFYIIFLTEQKQKPNKPADWQLLPRVRCKYYHIHRVKCVQRNTGNYRLYRVYCKQVARFVLSCIFKTLPCFAHQKKACCNSIANFTHL